MSKVTELQEKVATLREETAAEVLDFLEFVTSRSLGEHSTFPQSKSVRGRFRGRLSSSERFAASKKSEIALEK